MIKNRLGVYYKVAIFLSISFYFYFNYFERKKINPLLVKINERIDFDQLTPDYIKSATEYSISQSDSILKIILSTPDSSLTFENTFLLLDNIYNITSRVWNPMDLISNVSNNLDIREACNASSIKFSNYFVNLSLNKKLYNILKKTQKVESSKVANHLKKFMISELRDFEKSGLNLSLDKKNKLKKILNRITKLSIDFNTNIISSSDSIFINKELMNGMSNSFIQDRYIDNGVYYLDLSYPTYYPYMKYAMSDSIRKLLHFKFLNKGMPGNITILDEIIQLRDRYAKLLGYSSYAQLSVQESMIGHVDSILSFEYSLLKKVNSKANLDIKKLLFVKNKTKPSSSQIYGWEKYYYENMLFEEMYGLDEQEISKYFKLENVISGFFTITNKLFGINYNKIENPSAWHEDVTMYEVLDSKTNVLLGTFYLDLFPRENKYQHAAEFTIYSSKKVDDTYQLPVAALVCNFTKGDDLNPSLLTHEEVETFFHEFGHLIHDVLSRTELSSQSGTSVPIDFVEAPSQMLEYWAWNIDALKLFAFHYQTGEVIPDTIINRMLNAKNIQSGNDLKQQIFYGLLDLNLHNGFIPENNRSSTELMIKLQNSITNYKYTPQTNQLASFDHLIDYSSSYYGYLWSEVYAADMYSIFEDNGILDSKTGMKYRELILLPGGSKDPLEMVESFLGRSLNNKAFLIKRGISFK